MERPAEVGLADRLLAGLLATVTDAVVVTDPAARVLMTNPAFDAAVGEPCVGQPLFPLLQTAAAGDPGTRFVGADDPHAEVGGTLCPKRGAPVQVRVRTTSVAASDGSAYAVRVLALPPPPPARVAGLLQLGLDRVRQALGPRWNTLRDQVLQAAEQLIRGHLDPDDTLARTEDGFLLAFARAGEEEAGRKLAALAEEVTRTILGARPETAAVAASGFAAELPPSAKPADAAATTQALRGARAAAAARGRELLSAAAGTATLDLDPAFNVSGRRADITFAKLRDGQGGRLDRLAWSCSADRDPDIMADYALLGVGTALAAIATGKAPPGLLVLGLPVEALLLPRLAERLPKLMGGAPKALRDRLVIELTGLRADMSKGALAELVQGLAPLCRGAGVRLPDPGMHDLVHGVLRLMPVVTLHADLLTSPQLPRLVTMLHATGAILIARHVNTEDALMELVQTGIAHLTGSALGGGDPALG